MYSLTAPVQRFPGPRGWFYVELPTTVGVELRPLLPRRWPALIPVRCTIGGTSWDGSIQPIHAGPLFIAIPAPVRRKEKIDVDDTVTLAFSPRR